MLTPVVASYRRKIQFIGKSTYTLSLPKSWITSLNLKQQQELLLLENADKTLTISADTAVPQSQTEISLVLDEYPDLSSLILAAYYRGFETIHLVVKQSFSHDQKRIIRNTLLNLSGTEIVDEQTDKITLKVMLDLQKINFLQLLYRLSLIIDSSIDLLINKIDWQEVKLNEDEIDRLYHAAVKIITVSLDDHRILSSSGIGSVQLIPSYFLISKRLENIADKVKLIARLSEKKAVDISESKKILGFLKEELSRTCKYLVGPQKRPFHKLAEESLSNIETDIKKIVLVDLQAHLKEILRHVASIQDEVGVVSFNKRII
ncbi:MAG: hypothetical protein KC535_00810 [Nanoarchaeota archaeon]|nr:hypothetical protein [Nanoarchaeota archaeon]